MRDDDNVDIAASNQSVDQLVAQLHGSGVRLWIEGDQLKLRAPKGSLTPSITAAVSRRKADILDYLRKRRAPDLPRLTLDPAQRHQPFPLTDMQEAYWLGQSDAFALGRINAHLYTEFELADIDWQRAHQAVQRLIARHDVLRGFVLDSGEQRILPEVPPIRWSLSTCAPPLPIVWRRRSATCARP